MTRFTRLNNRNLLYAASALPPAIFILSGNAALGLLFLLCVVAARFSRPTPSKDSGANPPDGSR